MTKVISFSLWGKNPKYCVGALRNAEIAQRLYSDWECWFFCRSDVDGATMLSLTQMPNCKVIFVDEPGNWTGMFDRFAVAADPNVEAMISRDCDSRLGEREKAAVDEWLASDRDFHIMRDHPWHGSQILGGMWGAKKGILADISTLMGAWQKEDRWQTDQDFLNTIIYPRVVNSTMVHAQFFGMEPHAVPFPTRRQGLEFVGQVFDENDMTVAEHQMALMKVLKGRGEPIRRENLPSFLQ